MTDYLGMLIKEARAKEMLSPESQKIAIKKLEKRFEYSDEQFERDNDFFNRQEAIYAFKANELPIGSS